MSKGGGGSISVAVCGIGFWESDTGACNTIKYFSEAGQCSAATEWMSRVERASGRTRRLKNSSSFSNRVELKGFFYMGQPTVSSMTRCLNVLPWLGEEGSLSLDSDSHCLSSRVYNRVVSLVSVLSWSSDSWIVAAYTLYYLLEGKVFSVGTWVFVINHPSCNDRCGWERDSLLKGESWISDVGPACRVRLLGGWIRRRTDFFYQTLCLLLSRHIDIDIHSRSRFSVLEPISLSPTISSFQSRNPRCLAKPIVLAGPPSTAS